jgi:hypothetical protein
MDRRKYLKVLGLTTVSGSLLLDACKEPDTKTGTKEANDAAALSYDRTEEEKARHQALISETFFTPHEMATIAVLSFFNLMRNLTATGFYSSEIGIKDVGYAGNKPNQWNGVPDDVLKQYGLAYTEKELKECVKFA